MQKSNFESLIQNNGTINYTLSKFFSKLKRQLVQIMPNYKDFPLLQLTVAGGISLKGSFDTPTYSQISKLLLLSLEHHIWIVLFRHKWLFNYLNINGMLYFVYYVTDIIIGYPWTGWQADASLEK